MPTEAERLEILMKLAQKSKKFGSMSDRLSPEFLARPRDFGGLSIQRTEQLPKGNSYNLLHTSYGLPPSGVTGEEAEKIERIMHTPYGL